jgi:hypothetical protein
MLAGLSYVIGASLCAWAQSDKKYAAMGASPRQWLYRGAIDALASSLPVLLSYLTWHRQEEIDTSARNNSHKAELIRKAIIAGIVGPALFLLTLSASLGGVGRPSETTPVEEAEGRHRRI